APPAVVLRLSLHDALPIFDDAIARADAAVAVWAATPVADRAKVIHRIAELHRERRDALAAIIVKEMGKPIAAAEGEVDFAADIIDRKSTRLNSSHVKISYG